MIQPAIAPRERDTTDVTLNARFSAPTDDRVRSIEESRIDFTSIFSAAARITELIGDRREI